MNISNNFNNFIGQNKDLTLNQTESQTQNFVEDRTFANMLKKAVDETNVSQINAYDAMEGIATGKVKNLQEAVQRINEADLTLKLGLEVKNKAITSYKEIMKMTV